jgi:microcystin degradation protein MlrC
MHKRILLAGLFHETHTFLAGTTRLEDFAVRRGEQLYDAKDDSSPLSGLLEVAAAQKWELVPAIDMRATPGPIVDDAVFEYCWEQLTQSFSADAGRPIHGIFLVLHGALVCRTVRDVEGTLIRRLRAVPALANVPICGVLDLHGNISKYTIERTHGLIAYRSNPHVDARQAAIDAALLLDRILTVNIKPVCVFEQSPIMWPPTGTGTGDDPMRTLESMARKIERDDPDIVAINVMAGFSFADTRDTGVSFSAVTFGDPAIARRRLQELTAYAYRRREAGNVVDRPLEVVMPEILKRIAAGQTPVAIVEPADNVGGGAPGDAPTILRALLEHGVARSAVILNDPETVAQLRDVPIRGCAHVALGGKGSRLTDPPLNLEVELLSRSAGRFDLEDCHSHLASMSGVHIEMGPCATVRSGGVTILLTSKKTPPFDLGQLRSQGIRPERLAAIAIKAAVAHRRAYDPIIKSSFTVATPGPCSSDLRSFPFKHIRRPIYPLDPLNEPHESK